MLSLIPGTSRSGSTIIGGLLLGCTRSVASKFTFFLAIPVMFGASFLKLVKFFLKGGAFDASGIAILGVGCAVAFVVSLVAIKWLMGFGPPPRLQGVRRVPHRARRRGAGVLHVGVSDLLHGAMRTVRILCTYMARTLAYWVRVIFF
ncbi:MAG: undecaprenyl-diphosphate phosphatase [Collinsella sp.]